MNALVNEDGEAEAGSKTGCCPLEYSAPLPVSGLGMVHLPAFDQARPHLKATIDRP